MDVNKRNIFEHILYEFQMYLYSYQKLVLLSQEMKKDNNWQLEYNLAWDAHFLHLRNIIEFFNNSEHAITTLTVLKCNPKLFIEDAGNEHKRAINKSIDHLTIERVNENMTEKSNETFKYMINLVPQRIVSFLLILDDKDNVKVEYLKDLEEDYIGELIKSIKTSAMMLI